MTKAQAATVARFLTDILTDDTDEAESLELVHLELRQSGDDGTDDRWIIQTDCEDREDDEWVHRTFITVIDAAGDVTESYESN